jgi:hypothetical protein
MSTKLNDTRNTFLMMFSDMQTIEGKLLTIVDSLGLESQQGNAVKSLVRQAIWDEVHQPYRVWITDEMVETAHKEWSQYQGHGFSGGIVRTYKEKSK